MSLSMGEMNTCILGDTVKPQPSRLPVQKRVYNDFVLKKWD